MPPGPCDSSIARASIRRTNEVDIVTGRSGRGAPRGSVVHATVAMGAPLRRRHVGLPGRQRAPPRIPAPLPLGCGRLACLPRLRSSWRGGQHRVGERSAGWFPSRGRRARHRRIGIRTDHSDPGLGRACSCLDSVSHARKLGRRNNTVDGARGCESVGRVRKASRELSLTRSVANRDHR